MLVRIVAETIENMQPPNAMDHLMGAFAQFAQVKMMRSLEKSAPAVAEIIPTLAEGLNEAP